jgi:hypothetical protein
MEFIRRCGRFCHWLGHCLNQRDGSCRGYLEPDDEDDMDDRIERLTY